MPSSNVDIYVALNGSDSASGRSVEEPVRTLQQAQSIIRNMRAIGYDGGITVNIREGEYNMSEQLALSKADSGTADAPVVWRNYKDEAVTLTGGVSVAGSLFQKVSDSKILNRIVEPSARDSVYMLDLKTYGITDPGEPYYNGAYSYHSSLSNFISKPNASGVEVFYNNKAMTNARYPNDGFIEVKNVIDPGWNSDEPDLCEQGSPFIITVDDDRIANWTKAENPLMYGFWKWDWADQTVPLVDIDVTDNQLTSKWHSLFGVKKYAAFVPRFYVWNLIEEMDEKGEYYIDRENSVLYINAPNDIETANISLSVLDKDMISLNGARYVSFEGLTLRDSRKSAFRIENSTGCSIKGCDIYNTADMGIYLDGTNNTVSNFHIFDVNGGVAVSGGNFETLTSANNKVINCHIERFSRLSKTYTAAVALSGVGNMAAFNKIHNAPHLAVTYGGNNNLIYYNEIYDVVQHSDDAGAIYGGLSWSSRGHEVKYNYIHDIKSDNTDIGIWGIYLDGAQSDMLVEGNVLENIDGEAIFIGSGRDNVIKNNYSINCKAVLGLKQTIVDVNTLQKHHYPSIPAYVWKDGVWLSDVWKQAYPNFYNFMQLSDEEKIKPKNNVFENNLCFNNDQLVRLGGTVSENGYLVDYEDKNYITEVDPGFVSLGETPNYGLKKDAPVLSVLPNLERLPFDCMGLNGSPACLTKDGAYCEKIGDNISCYLYYKGSADEEVKLVFDFYEKNGDELQYISTETVSVPAEKDEILHYKKDFNLQPNIAVNCYLQHILP